MLLERLFLSILQWFSLYWQITLYVWEQSGSTGNGELFSIRLGGLVGRRLLYIARQGCSSYKQRMPFQTFVQIATHLELKRLLSTVQDQHIIVWVIDLSKETPFRAAETGR